MLGGRSLVSWPAIVAVVCVALSPGSARADDVAPAVTNQRVPLRPKPEESAAPSRHLATGSEVTILERDGRWLYVKAGKDKGWITRTTIDEDGDDDVEPGERWGDKAASWGDDMSENRAAAAARDDEGDGELDDGADASASARGPAPEPPRVALRAGVGFRSVAMDFTSDGSAPGAAYVITAQAAAAAVGAHLHGRIGPLRITGDAEYRAAYSDPGVRYQASAGGTDDIALTAHEAELTLGLGVRASDAMGGVDVFGQVGYLYGAYLVGDLGNLGKLPNESLRGLAVGGALRAARIGDDTSLTVDGGMLVGPTREQTAGLEDGMSTYASATWVRARLAHAISARLELVGEYAYSARLSTWEGGSARFSDATRADRRDTMHTVIAGLSRGF